jgi:hypothetical protein
MIYTPTKKANRKQKDPVLKELSEKLVHLQVCAYLNLQHPDVYFLSDAGGMRVTIGLRQEISRKSPNRYKVLDLTILAPRKGFAGLIIEVKKKGEKIKKRNGEYVSEHIAAQAKSIAHLNSIGYCACFGIGYDECISIIQDYLK